MNQDDPFGNYLDEDKTVLKPSPGRRNQSTASRTNTTQQPSSDGLQSEFAAVASLQLNIHSDKNLLLGCAVPLLLLIAQLRNSATHADVPGLRKAVIHEIKLFDKKALQSGCPAEQVQTARYALCSLLDEVVLNTPWGCQSIWSTQGMLITFHKESWGGEKFFQVLNKIISQPGIYLDLLELFYYCLSMGFEGKYKIQELGQNKLFDIRENLYQVIQRQKGDIETELAIRWRGITDKRHLLSRYIPMWVVYAVTVAILMLVFIGFLYAIQQQTGPVIAGQYQIRDGLKVLPTVKVDRPQHETNDEVVENAETSVVDLIRQFLAAEIAQKKVAVIENEGYTTIRILAPNFFASGSDKIQVRYLRLVEKISQALERVNGQITVVGHTDNIPIFTVRFPSNWELSLARAQAVSNILSLNKQLKQTMSAEGRADTQNLVANDTAIHRAINRRVEINFKDRM